MAAHPLIFHLVITEAGLFLVKRPGATWRTLQGEFEGYKTSMGPHAHHFFMALIEHEWPAIYAEKSGAIRAFETSSETLLAL
ncbi:MAG: hypothetical protein AB7J28_07670 [Hyphomonadaceae bacterium]